MLVSLINFSLFSQNKAYNKRYLENYDDKDIHFGFYFGTGLSRLNIGYNDDYNLPANNTISIVSPPKFAFKVGLVVNKYIDRRWDIRATPGINISSKTLDYKIFDGTIYTEKADSRDLDFFELPILFKFKSERRKNSRMYMTAGANFLVETNIRKGTKSALTKLPTKNKDLCLEYGFGFEQFLEYGKFSGELRFSHGLNNLFVPDASKPQIAGIDKLNSHTVTLYLFFE